MPERFEVDTSGAILIVNDDYLNSEEAEKLLQKLEAQVIELKFNMNYLKSTYPDHWL